MKQKQIGIFGGTFNPIHIGHIKMAEAARKEYKLDVVYFIPCGVPPHKYVGARHGAPLSANVRYNLVKKAIKKKKYFKVLDIEIKKKKPCYTIDTIKTLVGACYGTPLRYFIIGQDEFEKLHTWKNSKGLADLVTFLVLPRSNKKVKVPKVQNLQWSIVHTKPINISSTQIRKKLKKINFGA